MAPTYIKFLIAFFRNIKKSKKKSKKNPQENSPSASQSEQEENTYVTHSTDHKGHAFYITDCIGVTIGDHYTYYNGTVYYNQNHYTYNVNNNWLYDWLEDRDHLEMVEKNNDINLLMECTSKLTRKYVIHTAEYIGSKWQKTFVNLGINERIIENYLYENPTESIREIRYQILRDWQRNSDNNTLGYLSAKLWQSGHRRLVNELAIMYRIQRLRSELQVDV